MLCRLDRAKEARHAADFRVELRRRRRRCFRPHRWCCTRRSATDPVRSRVHGRRARQHDAGLFLRHHRSATRALSGPAAAPSHWLNQLASKAGNDLRDSDTREKYDHLQEWNDRAADPESRELHRLVSVHQDNPAYFDIDRWEWTEEGKLYLQALGDMTSHRRQRMLNGRWVAAEGSVYLEFNEDIHVCEPFDIPETWPVYVGYDPGYAHPTAVLWLAVAPNESYYIIDEIYQGGRSVEEHAREIIRKNRGRNIRCHYGDPQHMFSQTAQSPRTIADQLRACGLSFSPWPRTAGQEEAMVEAVRQLLAARDGIGYSRLQVFSTCPHTIAEFQSWSYRRTPKGDLPPGPDKFEDTNNHAMDVVKGLVARRPRYEEPRIQIFQDGVELTRGPSRYGRPRWYDEDEDD